jgi:hypothetical protein
MALLRSYVDGTSWFYGYSGTLLAQTFTIPAGYDRVEYFRLKLKKLGSPSGTSYAYLYATSGGIPTSEMAGASLANSSISTTATWYTFDITDQAVGAGSRYAVVFLASGTSSSSTIAWMSSSSGTNPYTDGTAFSKTAGGSWSTTPNRDFDFEVYGYLSATPPTITGGSATSVAETSATLNANATADNGSAITNKGFYWGYSSGNMPYGISVGSGVGAFSTGLTGLPKGTTIYAIGFASNAMGTVWTSVFSFTTLADAPSVASDPAGALQTLQATLNGRVTSQEGASVTTVGFVISETSVNANPLIGGTGVSNYTVTPNGVASYQKIVTGLDPNTQYSFKIYAINGEGTTYGSALTFTTLNAVAKYAQQFTATATGVLSSVALWLRLASGTAGKCKVSIWSEDGTEPDAKLADLVLADVTNSAFEKKSMSVNLPMVSGDSYWIQIEDILGLSDPANQYQVQIGSNNAGGYAGGVAKKQNVGSATWDAVTGDLTFEANIQPTMSINYSSNIFSKKRFR